eukprot:jgi/Botrbrau1/23492/Bobra.106_1s0043.1
MPRATRLQIIGVLLFYLSTYFAPLWSWPTVLGFLIFGNNVVRVLVILYIISNIWGPFNRGPFTGSWPQPLRRVGIWRHAAAYFPLALVKTADIPSDRSYIFAFHPHGIFSISAFLALGTDGAGFSDLFPGLRMHLMTLVINFYCPLLKEVLLLHGICNCSIEACRNILSKGHGESITLVVGGAKESLAAEPDAYDLVLNSRKGFVRMALEVGADLVPVLSFGENNLYRISHFPRESLVGKMQHFLLRSWGYTVPAISGKGLMGFLPYQKRLAVVVGAPIRVSKYEGSLSAPEGRKAVDQLHRRYMEALRQLWDQHKGRFAIDRKRTLQIIDELPVPVPPALPVVPDQEESSGSDSSGPDSGPES